MKKTQLTSQTCLIWNRAKTKITPFYRYNHGIGYIPAEVEFQYRRKHYGTKEFMQVIWDLHKKGIHPQIGLDPYEWYDGDFQQLRLDIFRRCLDDCRKLL